MPTRIIAQRRYCLRDIKKGFCTGKSYQEMPEVAMCAPSLAPAAAYPPSLSTPIHSLRPSVLISTSPWRSVRKTGRLPSLSMVSCAGRP